MRPDGLRVVAALLVAVGAGYLAVALLAPMAAEALAAAQGVAPDAAGAAGRSLALVCAAAALASAAGLLVLRRARQAERGLGGLLCDGGPPNRQSCR